METKMKMKMPKHKPKLINTPTIPSKSSDSNVEANEDNLAAIDKQLAELDLLADDDDDDDDYDNGQQTTPLFDKTTTTTMTANELRGMAPATPSAGGGEKGENVKVMVRCRPLNSNERDQVVVEVHEEDKCVEVSLASSVSGQQQQPPEQREFPFDAVFGPNCTNEQVYMKSVRQLVEFAFKGYNCTVFLYGQTGTGKTYTHSSLTLSSFAHLFSLIRDSNTQVRFLIRASYYELYNEEIRDLLSNNPKKPSLELRESKSRGVYVKDLSCYLVNNLTDLEKLKRLGDRQRATAATKMNEHSSRSHSIFSLTIETVGANQSVQTNNRQAQKVAASREVSRTAKSKRTSVSASSASSRKSSSSSASIVSSNSMSTDAASVAAVAAAVRVGQLHLVDLAGSERQSKSGSSGARLKEASRINLSLTCLSLVIRALTDETSTHVPYRNSKLTRLLSSSLGGNSKTLLIACVSPAKGNLDETLNTLRFASRTKRIKNKAKINENAKDALLRKYRRQIEELRCKLREHTQLQEQQEEGGGGGGGGDEDELVVDYDAIENSLNTNEHCQTSLINSKTGDGKTQTTTAELLQQLRFLKAKIMVGGENLLEKAEMHERLLEASRAELEEKQREELRLKEKLATKQKLIERMTQTKGSLEGQVVNLDEKLKRVLLLYKRCKEEQRDLGSEHQQLKESLLQTIRATSKEIKYADCIIEDFIPREYLDLINTYAQYDDESDEWQIKYIALSGNNIAQTKRITENGTSGDGVLAGAAILSAIPGNTNEGNKKSQKLSTINFTRSDPFIRLKDLVERKQ